MSKISSWTTRVRRDIVLFRVGHDRLSLTPEAPGERLDASRTRASERVPEGLPADNCGLLCHPVSPLPIPSLSMDFRPRSHGPPGKVHARYATNDSPPR